MLHKKLSVTILCLALINVCAWGANPDNTTVKDGWSVNPLPALGYDSDFGLMAGGFLDINYYGGLYPNYKHRICLEALVFTKHSSYYMMRYDSKYLIPGIRTQAKFFFDNNPLYSFYGFNGAVHNYDSSLNTNQDKGVAYYSYDRKFFNSRLELEGDLTDNLDWYAGFSYWHYWIKELNWKGYDSDYTLFGEYRKAGLIRDDEADGGNVAEFQVGLKYDTRDMESTPTRGIFCDVIANYAPDLFNTGHDYFKLSARFRQFLSLGTERLVLAYSLAFQGTLAGNPAFYSQPSLMHFKPSDGLGGATTLRGVLYNRVVGDDYLWGNFEIRARIMDFSFLKRRVFAVFTPFFDAGMIIEPFRFDSQVQALYDNDNVSQTTYDDYRSTMFDKARKLHMSAGISAQAIIDYNFIPSLSFGIPFDKSDGDYGIYMTLDYIF